MEGLERISAFQRLRARLTAAKLPTAAIPFSQLNEDHQAAVSDVELRQGRHTSITRFVGQLATVGCSALGLSTCPICRFVTDRHSSFNADTAVDDLFHTLGARDGAWSTADQGDGERAWLRAAPLLRARDWKKYLIAHSFLDPQSGTSLVKLEQLSRLLRAPIPNPITDR
eukprot:688884-Rhodomonas_salina.1